VKRPNSLQLSVWTPAVECAGQVESVIIVRSNKEKFTILLCIFPYFNVLLGLNCMCTIYLLHELL